MGAPPFGAGGTVDILQAHRFGTLPRVTDERPDLPDSIETALLRALSKDREARFMSCRAFVAAARAGTGLESYATPRPRPTSSAVPRPTVETPRAVPVASVSPPPRSPGRKRVPTIAIAAVALVLLAAGGVAAGMLLGRSDDTAGPDPGESTSALSTATTVVRKTPAPIAKTPPKQARALVPIARDIELGTDSLVGYSVELPRAWIWPSREENVPPAALRTKAERKDRQLFVQVDHLPEPDLPAAEKRDAEKAEQRRADRKFAPVGGDLQYRATDTTAYEFRYHYESQRGRDTRRVEVVLDKADDQFLVVTGGYADWSQLSFLAERVAKSIELIDDPPPGNSGESTGSGDLPVPELGDYEGNAEEPGSGGGQHPIAMTFDEPGSADVTYERDGAPCRSTLSLHEDDLREGVPAWVETVEEGSCPAGVWRIDVDDDGNLTADWEPTKDDQTSTDGPSTIHATLPQP